MFQIFRETFRFILLLFNLEDMRKYLFLLSSLLLSSPLYATETLPNTSSNSSSSSSEADMQDLRSSATDRPQWGIQLTASPSAFGGNALIPEQGTQPFLAFSLLAEFQPAFFQSFGVLGLGPSLTVYPAIASRITESIFSILGVGGQVRYQMRYFRKQFLVPVVAYVAENTSFQFSNGISGWVFNYGPAIGLWLLLNSLDSHAAHQIYLNHGIAHSYLVMEYRSMQGQNTPIVLSGGSTYFGLRFEM